MAAIYTFLDSVLSDPNFHIPVEANFIVGFSNIQSSPFGAGKSILDKLLLNYTLVFSDRINITDTSKYWASLSNDDIFFANSVSLPGETLKSSRAGYATDGDGLHGSLLSGPILNGRSDNSNVSISFLETNQSFVDFVIRPWIIAAGHYGLTAKSANSNQSFKTDITVSFLDKRFPDTEHKYRKTILFKNAAPVSVEDSTFSYGGTKAGTRNVKTSWIYSTYEISQTKTNAV